MQRVVLQFPYIPITMLCSSPFRRIHISYVPRGWPSSLIPWRRSLSGTVPICLQLCW